MSLILDSNVVIWLGWGSSLLSRKAAAHIQSSPEVYVSPLTVVELSIKSRKGKLSLGAPAAMFVQQVMDTYGFLSCPLDIATANLMDTIPMHHDDPFDRMLICQALMHNLAVVTPDNEIAKYPIQVIW